MRDLGRCILKHEHQNGADDEERGSDCAIEACAGRVVASGRDRHAAAQPIIGLTDIARSQSIAGRNTGGHLP